MCSGRRACVGAEGQESEGKGLRLGLTLTLTPFGSDWGCRRADGVAWPLHLERGGVLSPALDEQRGALSVLGKVNDLGAELGQVADALALRHDNDTGGGSE